MGKSLIKLLTTIMVFNASAIELNHSRIGKYHYPFLEVSLDSADKQERAILCYQYEHKTNGAIAFNLSKEKYFADITLMQQIIESFWDIDGQVSSLSSKINFFLNQIYEIPDTEKEKYMDMILDKFATITSKMKINSLFVSSEENQDVLKYFSPKMQAILTSLKNNTLKHEQLKPIYFNRNEKGFQVIQLHASGKYIKNED